MPDDSVVPEFPGFFAECQSCSWKEGGTDLRALESSILLHQTTEGHTTSLYTIGPIEKSFYVRCRQCKLEQIFGSREQAQDAVHFHVRNHMGHVPYIREGSLRISATGRTLIGCWTSRRARQKRFVVMCETCNGGRVFFENKDNAIAFVKKEHGEHRAYAREYSCNEHTLEESGTEYVYKTKTMEPLLAPGVKNYRMLHGLTLDMPELYGVCCPDCNLCLIVSTRNFQWGRNADWGEALAVAGIEIKKRFCFPRLEVLGYCANTDTRPRLRIVGEATFPHYCPVVDKVMETMQTKLLTEPPARKSNKNRGLL
jgi:hypothetical protein